jgi:hypothetical protein
MQVSGVRGQVSGVNIQENSAQIAIPKQKRPPIGGRF